MTALSMPGTALVQHCPCLHRTAGEPPPRPQQQQPALLRPRRFEMGMLQERADLTERDLATYRHDVGSLRAERDHLVNQVGAFAVVCCAVRAGPPREPGGSPLLWCAVL